MFFPAFSAVLSYSLFFLLTLNRPLLNLLKSNLAIVVKNNKISLINEKNSMQEFVIGTGIPQVSYKIIKLSGSVQLI